MAPYVPNAAFLVIWNMLSSGNGKSKTSLCPGYLRHIRQQMLSFFSSCLQWFIFYLRTKIGYTTCSIFTVFPAMVVDVECVVPLPLTVLLTVFPALLPTPTGTLPPIADGIAWLKYCQIHLDKCKSEQLMHRFSKHYKKTVLKWWMQSFRKQNRNWPTNKTVESKTNQLPQVLAVCWMEQNTESAVVRSYKTSCGW